MHRLILMSLSILSLGVFAFSAPIQAKPIDVALGDGDVLRVEPVAPGIVRIRLSADGKFAPSLMERYGIVRTEWPPCDCSVREEAGVTRIVTTDGSLSVRAQDGEMQWVDRQGKTVCERIVPLPTRMKESELPAFKRRQESIIKLPSASSFSLPKKSTGNALLLRKP